MAEVLAPQGNQKVAEEGEVIRLGQLLSRQGKSWTLSSAEAERGNPTMPQAAGQTEGMGEVRGTATTEVEAGEDRPSPEGIPT